ncbi:leucine--tRNA ligase [Dokdonia sp. Hel_I_53]|uniref:leucine--tRNA ligase n=1 Tax=Dokdonia sp. Hel_I_53 TaxID=1566287 RepID=UPI0011993FDD|nr:class I tRNA ligase family protein [Dokdonia sp. Hel_I_53]TVZ52851.1 leucyl-tRNA synthetase [Dokdonia sp. Hel_I_53]
MKYHFNEIEAKWQKYWADKGTFHASNNSDKPKYYVLDMFPYPSGAGLHVGHPLGYIASDVYARYKRLKGFNVLHPQGYDSFGLPAEQYAIQTGQHPAVTTRVNIEGGVDNQGNEIAGYRQQLDKIGFSFDWSREVRTSDPAYYKWTQWIFTELFNSWYNYDTNKAEQIDTLVSAFAKEGNSQINAACDEGIAPFTAAEWTNFTEKEQQDILLQYRLTYLAETEVNWCPALGTVLANDEIVNGVSERGGHTVVRKKMTQWSMRISAYAERLRQGLETIDWSESIKETQRNWIGKSVGATVSFDLKDHDKKIEVFTTRPDTIFGVSFMTLAPELDLVQEITTPAQKAEVDAYIEATAKRSERDRMADVKTISGAFTGAYAEHPFTKEPIPIWIGDYVLAGYGTGAVMAVPCGDQRDHDFATHFGIPIPNVFEGVDISEEAYADKEGTVITNSDFLNGLKYKKAVKLAIYELEKMGAGSGKTNYRLRDAVFSRQRYWGEPFPVYYDNGIPKMIDVAHLPIRLPEVEKYLPTEEGEPPLGRADVWAWDTSKNEVVSNDLIDDQTVFPLELNTMPGWAGSSWYFFRYMEKAQRDQVFASKEALDYWGNVDLYIGGSEHGTGHLLYSRFWVKFLKDRGYVGVEEPFQKMINQGMILGTSAFVYRWIGFGLDSEGSDIKEKMKKIPIIFSGGMYEKLSSKEIDVVNFENNLLLQMREIFGPKLVKAKANIKDFIPTHLDVSFIDSSNQVDLDKFSRWLPELENAIFIDDEGNVAKVDSDKFTASREVEKMSKSKYNVVNPDEICEQYGADTLRMYEMFLGPLEQAKPWNTAGITGVHSFLKKFWKLYHNYVPQDKKEETKQVPQEEAEFYISEAGASKDSLKTLHKTIKKVEEDIENFSFNTSVSTFMIAVNELNAQKCTSREVLEPLAILIAPYAPHIAEELWNKLGHTESISEAAFPVFDASHLVESSKNYPISFNGKMKFTLELPLDMSKDEIEKTVMAHEKTQMYLNGREPKKVIIVPGKIVNIVG